MTCNFLAGSRILFATWWIFVQVLTSFYTAELTAFLTLVDSSLPIKNLEDLKNVQSAKWIAIAGATFQNMVEVFNQIESRWKNSSSFQVIIVIRKYFLVFIKINRKQYLIIKFFLNFLKCFLATIIFQNTYINVTFKYH